jgi:selenide, water dikinase
MTPEARSALRLSQYARGGGCAAKLRLGELGRVLERLRAPVPADGAAAGGGDAASDIVVDLDFSDDAAVLRPTPDGRLLVLTADIIAPLVDDAATFGKVAATNAMSDVWAMGGEPRFALNLVFFPDELLPLEVLHEILEGAAAATAAAGVAIVGGHSVRDPELKFGLSVTGEVAPADVWSNRGAQAGQALVLTKALGTGILSQAVKQGVATAEESAAAIASMITLNRDGAAAGRRHGATSATDVTGFGLLGHLRNILRGSSLSATLELGALPLLPGARAHLGAGLYPGGSKANRKVVAPMLRWADGSEVEAALAAELADRSERELQVALACDAQTSGGLLLCVPAQNAAACVAELRGLGLPAAEIGRLTAPGESGPQVTLNE